MTGGAMGGGGETSPSGFAASAPGELEAQGAGAWTRLLCACRWEPQESAVSDLLASRAGWLRRSAATGVRTALLHAHGWLVRWHEGAQDAVHAEWKRLHAMDTDGLRLLHRSTGALTLAHRVQVVSLHAGETSADVARRFDVLARESAEPAELWQALAAPWRRTEAGEPAFLARRDLLAVSSEDHAAFDVVRLLAQASREPVTYQRFAGSELERRDCGAAYVDLPLARRVATRVHALPRRSLVDGVRMLGVRNAQDLVLLLGSEGLRTRSLLAEVQLLLRQLRWPPRVLVIAACAATRETAVNVLRPEAPAGVTAVDAPTAQRDAAALVWRMLADEA